MRTSDNRAHRWNGAAWIDLQDGSITTAQSDASQALIDASTAQATADGKVTTFYTTSTPTAEGLGDLWVNPDTAEMRRWNGSQWLLSATVNRWRGAWASGVAYVLNDLVGFGGRVYTCILAHTSSGSNEPTGTPSGNTWWDLFSDTGADGADGESVRRDSASTDVNGSGGPATVTVGTGNQVELEYKATLSGITGAAGPTTSYLRIRRDSAAGPVVAEQLYNLSWANVFGAWQWQVPDAPGSVLLTGIDMGQAGSTSYYAEWSAGSAAPHTAAFGLLSVQTVG